MSVNESKSPFENLVSGIISSNRRKVKDIHPEDFLIIMDSIFTLFFNQNRPKGRQMGLEGLIDSSGIKIEFSTGSKYPSIRRDNLENCKVIVLPDNNESEELKQFKAQEALKEFDCLQTLEKYELCLRIFHSFSEEDLATLAREYDPFKRDTGKLEERLKERKLKYEEIK